MAKKEVFEFFFNQLVKGYRSIMGKDPEGLDLIKIKQEARQKLIDQDKVIEVQFGKPFGEEVDKLIESGDVKIGEVTKKNNNVLQREMFQNSNLNKPTIEGQMEKITNASNRIDEIIKEQADMYKPKTDAEIKAKFEKQNKEAAERLRNKMKNEPEDKADGGRIGFAGGKIVLGKKILNLLKNNKKIQEAIDNIFGTGDYKMDAEMAAESLVELNPTTFGNKLYEDLDDITRSEIYGAVLKPITTNMAKMRELKKASRPEKTLAAMKEGKGIDMSNPEIADEFTRFMKETSPDDYKKLEQTVELANFDPKKVKGNAEGGRIGFQEGGLPSVDPRMNLDYDTLVEQNVDKRLQDPNFLNNIQGVKAPEGTLGPITTMPVGEGSVSPILPVEPRNQPGSLEEYLSGYADYKAKNPNTYMGTQAIIPAMLPGGIKYNFNSGAHANHFNDYLESIGLSPYEKYYDETMIEKFNQGGRAGFYTGGITDVEPDLSDIGHGSDSLMARTRLVSPDGQATTSTGLNYLLAEDNDNIRIPFAKGKIAKEVLDKGRRGFMKAAGAAGAGIAALKTGLLGFGEKAAPVVETAVQTAKETAKGVPPYFFKLVDKIKSFGEDVTEKAATLDRQKVTKYKDFELTEDVATGEMTIQRMKVLDDGSESYYGKPLTEETYMNYKPGKGQADESTKGIPPDEYEQGTAYIRSDREYAGEVVDESFEISDDVLEEVGETITKKAEGGRIGMLAGGGILKAILKNSADAKGMTVRDFIMAMNPKSIPSNIKNLISKVDLEQLKAGYKDYYENISDMMKTRFDFQKNIEGGKTTPARELFEDMEKTMDKQSYVPKTVTQDDISKIELMIKNKFNKGRKDNANGGIQTMLGE